MNKNKKILFKIIILIIVFIIIKIFIINPIEERKQLLESEKYQISEEIKKVEQYKRQTEILKNSNKKEEVPNNQNDLIYIKSAIDNNADVQSIENIITTDDNGQEISKINLKFVGTSKEILNVMDKIKNEKISNKIDSIKIFKVNENKEYIKEDADKELKNKKNKNIIDNIKKINEEKKEKKKTDEVIKFECTLELVGK